MPHIDEVECSAREAYVKWDAGSSNNSPLEGYKIEMQTNLDDDDEWHEVKDDISGDAEATRVRFFSPILTQHSLQQIYVS